jgi:hypothetical protein
VPLEIARIIEALEPVAMVDRARDDRLPGALLDTHARCKNNQRSRSYLRLYGPCS